MYRDVYGLKIYGASDGNQGDFPVLLDTIVESPELLVDSGSASGVLKSGYLQNLNHINKYWNSYGGDGADAKLNPAFSMSLADSAYLSGSYSAYNESGRFETNKLYAFTIRKDIPYTISFKAIGQKTTKNDVAGNTDILLVPNVETGNALVKMMVYFMGACAAGVVIGGKAPIVITSRADESEARLASIAAAIVSLD